MDKKTKRLQAEAKLRKVRERPFGKTNLKKPNSTAVMMGLASVFSAVTLGFIATKLGEHRK